MAGKLKNSFMEQVKASYLLLKYIFFFNFKSLLKNETEILTFQSTNQNNLFMYCN